MRTIAKGPEPRSLAKYRERPDSNYEDFPGKDKLREALNREQRGLCCFCMGRISPTIKGMKIAHWRSQTGHPAEQLVYGNLIGACKGGEGQRQDAHHCDTRQRNRDLSRNPANPAHRVSDLVRYLGDGTIASDDADFQADLNVILGLNLPWLRNNRKAVLAAFQQAMGRRGVTRTQLESWELEWSGRGTAGDLQPYCQVVVYWLRKRLNRMVS